LQGSNLYYTKVQVRNTRFPVNSVYLNVSGKWVSTARTSDNFFLYTASIVAYPLGIKIYGIDGQCLIDSIPSLSNDNAINGNVQFASLNNGTICEGPSNDSKSSHLSFFLILIALISYLLY